MSSGGEDCESSVCGRVSRMKRVNKEGETGGRK